jgi:hypothetical protein
MFANTKTRRPGPQLSLGDPFGSVGVSTTDSNLSQIGIVSVAFKGRLSSKSLWATGIPGDRILFVLTAQDTDRMEAPFSSLDWEMLTIQPRLNYDQLYSIDLSNLPTQSLPAISTGPVTFDPIKSTAQFACFSGIGVTVYQELLPGTSPSEDLDWSGTGLTVERLLTY